MVERRAGQVENFRQLPLPGFNGTPPENGYTHGWALEQLRSLPGKPRLVRHEGQTFLVSSSIPADEIVVPSDKGSLLSTTEAALINAVAPLTIPLNDIIQAGKFYNKAQLRDFMDRVLYRLNPEKDRGPHQVFLLARDFYFPER